MKKKFVRYLVISLASLTVLYVAAALIMIFLPDPEFKAGSMPELTAAQMEDMGFDQVYAVEPSTFRMRDGVDLFACHFPNSSNLTVIILHGVLGSGYLHNKQAGLIRAAAHADVYALDLRGHGQSGGQPGDVDYIDQYRDDLADVVSQIRRDKPEGKIVIAGHSMGGGVALRYAMNTASPAVDGYLLFAPHLGFNSPTVLNQPASAGQTDDIAESFVKLHLPRIIGCVMLNAIGITAFNDRGTLFFNLPEQMPLRTYTFRSSSSMAPDDYRTGLQAVKQPLLVVVGTKDEAFNAREFEPAVHTYSKGEIILIDGGTHNNICHHSDVIARTLPWFNIVMGQGRQGSN